MFRLSGELYQDGRLLRSCVSRQEGYSVSRTQHVMDALREICEYLDLAVPIWSDSSIREFKLKSKTCFRGDAFIEAVSFDYMKIEVIEE